MYSIRAALTSHQTPGKGKKKNKKKKGSNKVGDSATKQDQSLATSTPAKDNGKPNTSSDQKKKEEKLKMIMNLDWNKLLTTPGMPELSGVPTPDFSNSLSEKALKLADTWINIASSAKSYSRPLTDALKSSKLEAEAFKTWSSQQVCVFFEKLLTFVENVVLIVLVFTY